MFNQVAILFVSNSKIMKNSLTIGIDVSKLTLDWAVFNGQKIIFRFHGENTQSGIKAFLSKLKKEKISAEEALYCLEYTGLYINPSLYYLHEKRLKVWVETPLQIKRSMGFTRGKNDSVDAERIAIYAFKNQEKARLWSPPRLVIVKLKALSRLRSKLIQNLNSITVPLAEAEKYLDHATFQSMNMLSKKSRLALKKDIEAIDQEIKKTMKADDLLNHLNNIITSVVGVGIQTSVTILVSTNEFKSINDARKFACYAGVVPFEYQSGKSLNFKPTVSQYANKEVKKLLHMAALSSIAMNSEFKDYFDRKVKNGKSKMLVINAIRNKIIHRIFACVKENRIYEKNLEVYLANP